MENSPGGLITPPDGTPAIKVPATVTTAGSPPSSSTSPESDAAGEGTRSGGTELVQVTPPSGARAETRSANVKGRIDIADEVVEKVAAAAAYEVEGVADLGNDVGNALERMRERIGIGRKDQAGGVGVDIAGGEAEIDVPITVKYGHPIVDVARRVQANVAHQLHLMLGLKITAVNVTIDDIEMPENALSYKDDEGSARAGYSIAT